MKLLKTLAASPVVAALLFVLGCALLTQSGSIAQVWTWSQTPGNNATADPSINWAEGMSPSSVNDSARQMMAKIAQVRDDWSGANGESGTASAYVVTSNQGFDTLAHLNEEQICFTPSHTNNAGITLSVDGLTAEPIQSPTGSGIGAGVMVAGTPYCVVYSNSTPAFLLRSISSNPYNVPLGAVLDYTGATAPNSNFALAYGQCISRTTYATYFALVSTTFGACNGTTTFGVPDLRGRILAGLDNMGGSAAGRLTGYTSVGTSGGAQSVTLASGNMPQQSFTPHGSVTANLTSLTLVGNGANQVAGGNIAQLSAQSVANAGPTINVLGSANINASFSGNSTSIGNASPNSVSTVQPTLGVTKIVRIF